MPLPEKVAPQTTKPRFGGFFNRRAGKVPTPKAPVETPPSLPPTLPEIIESPAPEIITPTSEPQPEVTPTPESTPLPEKVVPQPTKSRLDGFFNRRAGKVPTPQVPVETPPSLPPTLPEIIESPAPEIITPTPEPQPEVTPTPESTPLPEKIEVK
ncbi:Cell division protein ZipA, interacts with FtsZ [Nostoc flagelliforme CCNUN1]|uniref:Cell division protein ZipA, interacts with FtsZ n=1 Tax=Nostoc flagelliforme CCNUN1 TaxID=2038116 RepID=A0A2K8STG6_9NOSO|nr:Cell division protein ZipA, interacts with FtsZ [Nostoc flagelliforme CCNUN1]